MSPDYVAVDHVVSLSEVAELAGVKPSAVSNWRKRFPDFPRPVGRSPSGRSAYYNLREVEIWLATNKRLDTSKRFERAYLHATNLMRGHLAVDDFTYALGSAICLASLADSVTHELRWTPSALANAIDRVEAEHVDLAGTFTTIRLLPSDIASQLVAMLADMRKPDLRAFLEFVLARQSRFTETKTSEDLTALLVELARPKPRAVVLDPASGEGGLLLRARQMAGGQISLYGQEISHRAVGLARQRLATHGISATVRQGDTLLEDAYPDLAADIVFCDPPYGVRMSSNLRVADPRWSFGMPAKSLDFAWLQLTIAHLSEDGRGFVVLPVGTLSRGGNDGDIRRRLLSRGAVEAVISLPPRFAAHSAMSLGVWVVTRPARSTPRQGVLLVDGARLSEAQDLSSRELVNRLVGLVRYWLDRRQLVPADGESASIVPVLNILGGDGTLVPTSWLVTKSRTTGQRTADLHQTAALMTVAHHAITVPDPGAAGSMGGSSWVRIDALEAQGLVEVFRGVKVPPEECRDDGVRVLRASDIREGVPQAGGCYLPGQAAKLRGPLTRPGDVVVSPASGRIATWVDSIGGHLLATPLTGIRILGDWISADLAAAFLTTKRNRARVAGTLSGFAKLKLGLLELPTLPRNERDELLTSLRAVDSGLKHARDYVTQAEKYRETLLELPSPLDSSGGEGH